MNSAPASLSCDDVREILAVQALEGHLATPDERVEQHCLACEDCRQVRQDYDDVTGLLAFGLPDAPPSPAVRDRLRLRLAVTREKRRPRWLWPTSIAAACGLSLALGVLIGALTWGGGDSAPADGAAVSHRYVLEAAAAAPQDAWGEVLVNKEAGVATLLAYELPALPDDRVYQFWFVQPDGSRLPADVLAPDGEGSARQVVNLPGNWSDIRGMCITREPAPGSDEPRGPYVLVAWWD